MSLAWMVVRFNTYTQACAHTGAPVVCNTHTFSGTYYTVPPVILLINTQTSQHTPTHTHMVDFLGCPWQTQPAEEFKGIVVALGEESRTRWKRRRLSFDLVSLCYLHFNTLHKFNIGTVTLIHQCDYIIFSFFLLPDQD